MRAAVVAHYFHIFKFTFISSYVVNLQVYIGHTDVKNLLASPVYAASIHIHPKYNNLNGSDYNNDIALIKLQDPLTFNSSVMPICLPAVDANYMADMIG